MWNTFLTDPKYAGLRHAVFAGGAIFFTGILQAATQTQFSPVVDTIITVVAAGGMGWLKSYTNES